MYFAPTLRALFVLSVQLNKKASDYLLSRNESSIIDVRELDFRVRNGNGYYLSTMATDIYYNVVYERCKSLFRSTPDG